MSNKMTIDKLEFEIDVLLNEILYQLSNNKERFLDDKISVSGYIEQNSYLLGYKDCFIAILNKIKGENDE